MSGELALLERSRELTAIDTLLAGAADGAGGVLVIKGPPGIGKTRLVEAGVEAAAARGMTLVRATASELESEFAFGLARELFERTLPELSPTRRRQAFAGIARRATSVLALEPEFGSAQGSETAFAAVHALYWLTANLAAAEPLLVAVDDAHWADTGSLRYLHYLGRRVGELPVALIVATRPLAELGERTQVLNSLIALVDAPIEPAPLSNRAVRTLARDRLGQEPDSSFVEACLLATDGNVFLLTELLRALAAGGVSPDAASSEVVTDVASDELRRRVVRQITTLNPGATALARAVAVLGEAELPRAAAVARLGLPAAQDAARALEQASLLAGGRPLRFSHPILSAAVTGDIPAGELADAHARSARLLAADGDSPDAVAAHLLRSEPAGDAWTVGTLRAAAAGAVARGAPETAVAYLRRAVAEPPEQGEKADVLLELGIAQTRSREFDEATPTLAQGLELAEQPSTRAELAIALGLAFQVRGDFENAIGVLDRARRAIPAEASESQLAVDRYLTALALLDPGWRATIADRVACWQSEARAGTLRDAALTGLVAGCAVAAGLPGSDWAPLARLALEGDPSRPFDRDLDIADWAYGWSVMALDCTDHLLEADAHYAAGEAESRRRGDEALLGLYLAYRARTAYRLGRIQDAETHCRTAVEFAAGFEGTAAFPFTLVDVLLEQGEIAEAERLLATIGSEGSPQHRAMVELMRGRVQLVAGLSDPALDDLLRAGEILDALELRHPSFAPWRQYAAEAAHALGRLDLASRLAGDELSIARESGAPSAIGRALRTASLLADPAEARTLLEESCALLGDSPASLDYAYSLAALGERLAGEGLLTEARERLRSALDLAHRCGATALAERAHRALVTAGGRPRRPATTGIQALTTAERQVALLAVDGLTNREIAQTLFVTLKTAERHLSRAYTKLGIAGRPELAHALSELRAEPDVAAVPA